MCNYIRKAIVNEYGLISYKDSNYMACNQDLLEHLEFELSNGVVVNSEYIKNFPSQIYGLKYNKFGNPKVEFFELSDAEIYLADKFEVDVLDKTDTFEDRLTKEIIFTSMNGDYRFYNSVLMPKQKMLIAKTLMKMFLVDNLAEKDGYMSKETWVSNSSYGWAAKLNVRVKSSIVAKARLMYE